MPPQRELARADRVLPGLWRLRLPLPWPGVPPGAPAAYQQARRGQSFGIAEIVMPDRDLLPGVEIETDLGAWQVHETPGHAPSHVVLHQPESGLLLSGDHLLGRVSLYYDFGYSPDPAGEFLGSLDVVDDLDVRLILAGHGRPVRGAGALIEANRSTAHKRLARVRRSISMGPRAPFDIVPEMLDSEMPEMMMIGWGLSEALCYCATSSCAEKRLGWMRRTPSAGRWRKGSDRLVRPRPRVRSAQRGQYRAG